MRRNITRRVCALILIVALCTSLCTGVFAYTGVSNWAKQEVNEADTLGIIPNSLQNVPLSGPMSRLDMCHLVVNLFEKITNTTLYPKRINYFSDTRDADVCVAYELGIVNGYTDGSFRPTKQITRQEFAKMIENLLNVLKWSEDAETLSAFVDEAKIDAWAVSATAQTIRLGIVTGSSGARLNPKENISIEQACVMFLRAYHVIADNSIGGPADPVGGEYFPGYSGVSSWAVDSLREADLLGILPDSLKKEVMTKSITRGQMCELAIQTYTALTGIIPKAESGFSDTNAEAIEQAYGLGIVSGFNDGTFRANSFLTRIQFFKITSNFLVACGFTERTDLDLLKDSFADFAEIGSWAQTPVALLHRMGIINGDNSKRVLPTKGTTCEQAIAMLMRTYSQVYGWCASHPLNKIEGPMTSPDVAQQVVELALSYVGMPYVWAGADPSIGFDCSGLVYYCYKQFGYNLHRAGDGMAQDGVSVSFQDIRPGDIIIYADNGTTSIQHVAIYIGDGMMVHARSSKTGVVINEIGYDSGKYIYSIRRIIK